MKGKINITVSFPIVLIEPGFAEVCQSLSKLTVGLKSSVPILNKRRRLIIDSDGFLYEIVLMKPLQYINFLKGFSLRWTGFGVCYMDIELAKIGPLSQEELVEYGLKIIKWKQNYFNETTLPIKERRAEFIKLKYKEDVLRYLFYFAGTEYYFSPEINDIDWRSRKGFIKY